MAEFQRVPIRQRPSRNWLPTAGLAFAAMLVIAIVKPWDWSGSAATGDQTPQPTFFVGPTEASGPRPYDPRLFGGREPDPAWELWPAGYVVQFGMSGPLKVHGQDGASGAPSASLMPLSSPAESAGHVPPPLPTMPSTGNVVDLGPADHLVALGINTPREVRVESVALWLLAEDHAGGADEVPIVRLPTLWESDHFIAIGVEDPGAPGRAGPWPPGLYRLEISTALGEIREVLLRVQPPLR